MRCNSLLVVVLLLGAAAVALPGAQAMTISPASLSSAGCHGHTPAAPAPRTYQCCVKGHLWTLPSSPVSVRPLFARLSDVEGDSPLPLRSTLNTHPATSVVPAVSPPGSAPLRI